MVRRTTWILLAVLVVVALAYAGWQRFAPAAGTATPTAALESPWSLSPEQIASLRISQVAGPGVVVLRRDPDQGWKMVTPPSSGSDSARIEAALTSALAPAVSEIIDAPADLGPFGLAPAQYHLTLLMKDGSSHSMDVGKIDPTGGVYYARLPGDARVWMVSRFSLEDLLGLVDTPPYPLPTATATTVGTLTP